MSSQAAPDDQPSLAPTAASGTGHRPTPRPVSSPRVAIVHDYLNQWGGAERVLEEFRAIWPDAPIYSSIYDRERMPQAYRTWPIHTTFMQHLPGIMRSHRPYLPLYPLAFARLDLRDFDLIISSSSAFAKNVHPAPGALHICYCHSPMRFAWNADDYARREHLSAPMRTVLTPLLSSLRRWDRRGTARVNHLIANSHTVADRIAQYYDREAIVIHPPVQTEAQPATGEPDDFYLIVTRLVPYKRLDIVVDAFNRSGLPLRIVGRGRDREALERRAGSNITFLGGVSDAEKERLYARCRATIFPAEDDFGIAQVEAQAAGRPVIAFQAGGALETVRDGVTGIFFDAQTPEAVQGAVERLERTHFDAEAIRAHARTFDAAVFRRSIATYVDECWHDHQRAQDRQPSGAGTPQVADTRAR